MITQERLRELVTYDENTGIFTSNKSRGCVISGKILGHVTDNGYIRLNLDKKAYRAHRLVFLYVTGEMPSDQIDHINGIRTDNRIINLRVVTAAQNNLNMRKKSNSQSRFKGISFNKYMQKWHVQIRHAGKLVHLGYHDSEVKAAYIYDMASLKFHGEYGKRNFLPLVV